MSVEIGDPQGQRWERVEALVNTGATYTTLPASLLRRLGVVPHDRASFRLGDGGRIELEIGRTWVRIGANGEFSLVVFGQGASEPLLGAVTLEEFRLAPDPLVQRLVPVDALLLRLSTEHTERAKAVYAPRQTS